MTFTFMTYSGSLIINDVIYLKYLALPFNICLRFIHEKGMEHTAQGRHNLNNSFVVVFLTSPFR